MGLDPLALVNSVSTKFYLQKHVKALKIGPKLIVYYILYNIYLFLTPC